MRKSTRLRALRLITTAAALPLLQVACTPDTLAQAVAAEVTRSTTQFVFDVSQTVFQNLLGL